jgi:hypothetical protein
MDNLELIKRLNKARTRLFKEIGHVIPVWQRR